MSRKVFCDSCGRELSPWELISLFGRDLRAMKRFLTVVIMFILCFSMFEALVPKIKAQENIFQVVVTANPLWTNTNLEVQSGYNVSITASGTWYWGYTNSCDPDGDPVTYDVFMVGNKGSLIAFVGPDPTQGQLGNSGFWPQYSGYWQIGSNGDFTSNSTGELWLGMNDDAVSMNTYDNSGSLTATISLERSNASQSSTSVICTPNPGQVDSAITCTAMVTGSSPNGTISWSSNSSTGSFDQAVSTLTSGTCATTYTDTSSGAVEITAAYSGDVNNLPSVASATEEISPQDVYTVTFTEQGLPQGKEWAVTFNGITSGGPNDTIIFTGIKDGTYPFTVGSIENSGSAPAGILVAIAFPWSGTVTVNGANANQTITFQYTHAWWDPTRDNYSFDNFGFSDWNAAGGVCYGMASTAMLYFTNYELYDRTCPYLPLQSPQAASTSDLNVSMYMLSSGNGSGVWELKELNNAALAILFNQVYGAPADNGLLPSPSASFPNETEQYQHLVGNLSKGQPVVVILGVLGGNDGTEHDWQHAVVACDAGTVGSGDHAGDIAIYLYDPRNCSQLQEAYLNPNTCSFTYDNFDTFYVMDPNTINEFWAEEWQNQMFLSHPGFWSGNAYWLSQTGYTIVLTDKVVSVNSNGMVDYFNNPGDSRSFVAGIPGSFGITQGSMQIYAIPKNIVFTVNDPSTNQTTMLITYVENETGQVVGHGCLLSAATSEGNLDLTVTPTSSGLSIDSGTTFVSANVTFFAADEQGHTIFQSSNMPIDALETANFTVNDWQLLNSTSQTSVTLQVSSSSQPIEVTTYNLANGQNELPQAIPEFSSFTFPLLLIMCTLVIAVLRCAYRRKQRLMKSFVSREPTQKMNTSS